MDIYNVDLTGVTDIRSLHERLRSSLPLPPWYGNNLDALYDALTELSGEVRIVVTSREGDVPENIREYTTRLYRVLRDAVEEAPGLTVCFEEKQQEPQTQETEDAEEAGRTAWDLLEQAEGSDAGEECWWETTES